MNPTVDREHRKRRMRRRRRRAYIRSVYLLPSMATLGNAVCGFAAMYVAAFDVVNVGSDPWAIRLYSYRFFAAAYLIAMAMVFDALDGRLARFTRHTTDFGGQLDSLADVVSFGAAPAFLALLVFKSDGPDGMPFAVTRLIWATAALYFCCAAIRLARFNVSNAHGEQHHYSFLGLPSPGAAGAVVGCVLVQQELRQLGVDTGYRWLAWLATFATCVLPVMVACAGLLMVSTIRYPHMVNRYLRGKRSVARLLFLVIILVLLIFQHRFVLGVGACVYALYGPVSYALARWRPRPLPPAAPAS